MFTEFFKFDLRFQLRTPLLWIAGTLFALLAFGAMSSDRVQIGGAIGNVHRNAPYVIVNMLNVFTVFGMFLAAAFIGSAVLRDHEYRIADLFYTTPMRKANYLFGRFSAGFTAIILVFVLIAIGMMLGHAMPWLDAKRLGPYSIAPYGYGFAVFVLPNMLMIGALILALAAKTRSMLGVYLGVIGFFVLWAIASAMTADLDNRTIAGLIDPFGATALETATRYWSAAERNTLLPALTGDLLLNRMLWLAVAGVFLFLAHRWYRLESVDTQSQRKAARATTKAEPTEARRSTRPVAQRHFGARWQLQVIWRQLKLDAALVFKSLPFLVMLAFGLMNLLTSLFFAESAYGTPSYPLTYLMLERMDESYTFFLLLIVTFYAGELIFREQTSGIKDVVDATPMRNGQMLSAKLLALLAVVVVFLLGAVLTAIGYQLSRGFTDIELWTYAKGMLLTAMPFLMLAVLALFFQVISNSKFLGYLLIILYLLSRVLLNAFNLSHPLYNFSSAPTATYSDMNGYGHLLTGHLWLRSYWALFCAILITLAAAFWVRGQSGTWRERWRIARSRLRIGHGQKLGFALALCGVAFVATGSWIYYNTNVKNEYLAADARLDRQADYEKRYSKYRTLTNPRIVSIFTEVDIYPDRQQLRIKGRYGIKNTGTSAITDVLLSTNEDVLKSYDLGDAQVIFEDKAHNLRMLRLIQPMAPGEERTMQFQIEYNNSAFPAIRAPTQVVDNGTFFNSSVLPGFGYSQRNQISDRNERRKRGLGEPERMAKLEDIPARANTYISSISDWVDFETIVSTSKQQTALAPGTLIKQWQQDDRNFFHYRAKEKILPFAAWLSAAWQVKRDQLAGMPIEIYYNAKHPYNIDRMMQSAKDSLSYFNSVFTPYQFDHLRILEFPRYERFAQAFAGTVPFSEALGFIADLRKPGAVDYVYYVTAHEVAHQWWAHQVIGANVQGSTMLSESLAQYSALLVMEKTYGREQMRQFLKYELDRYLRDRGGERVQELPLMRVEDQPYIHYRKGSLVFYRLRDEIGEDVLNGALKRYLQLKGFQQPPYTVSTDLLDILREVTPKEKQGLLEDLFETITFHDNRVLEAKARKLEDGRYEVNMQLKADKRRADGEGKESPLPVYDYIEVGVFARAKSGLEKDEKVLYLERKLVSQADPQFSVIVDELPFEVGFDPYNKLIDRVPSDNRKRVVLQ